VLQISSWGGGGGGLGGGGGGGCVQKILRMGKGDWLEKNDEQNNLKRGMETTVWHRTRNDAPTLTL
jgi:hypothetical protein